MTELGMQTALGGGTAAPLVLRRTLTGALGIVDFVVVSPPYTASGALVLPALTGTGAATHTAVAFTASGTPDLPLLTATGSAAHVAPVFTASGMPALAILLASGSATFTASGDTFTIGTSTIGGSATIG